MGMKVATYTRVSTDGQRTDLQIDEVRQYCQRRGFTIVGEFSDVASGARTDRAGLADLMRRARRREFDAVVVWAFDRMSRSLSHLVSTLEELNALGVQFISLREGIDTSVPTGKLIFHVMGALGEFERELIRSRVMAGMNAARRRGVAFGRPKSTVDRDRILRMRAAGQSFPYIARTLGTSVGTAFRVCKAADAAN